MEEMKLKEEDQEEANQKDNDPQSAEEKKDASKLILGSDSSNQTSPRGVVDAPNQDTDSDTSGSNNGTVLESNVSNQWKSLITGFLPKRRSRSMRRLATFPISDENLEAKQELQPASTRGKPSWREFEYHELAEATDNFCSEMLIGKGGHAEVYRGCLRNGQLVAVKKLTKGETEEGRIGDFLTELGIIAHVDHPNAAQVLGFCLEEGLHLVLQLSPHGSVASVLHGSKEKLDWQKRFKIALGVAEGLLYLHEGCHRRIIHRDIKASNILLTQDYEPQISDFGLAKWLPDKLPYLEVFPIEGTFGYMSPEYFMHGLLNEKTDVFAFGVLLLELISGRGAVEPRQQNQQSIVMWVKPLLAADKMQELVDPSLGNSYDHGEMNRAISVASKCIHHMSTFRPTMRTVVQHLRGENGVLEHMDAARSPIAGRLPPFDTSDSEDYTCSRYLKDLKRHEQLALEQ